jgi:hypothetical protein
LFQVARGRYRWNCGDPSYRDVLLFDVLFDSDVFTKDTHCPNCNTPIAAGMAKVCDGVFEGIYALTDSGANSLLGASRGKADIVVVRDDGSLWPREDWYDVPLDYVG